MLSGNRVADAGKMAQALGTSSNKTDIIVYEDEMHDDIMWSNYIKAYLETAIENEEFLVYLQPKFDIQSEKIKGAEALIRWNYKNKELLPPGRFIPFFENIDGDQKKYQGRYPDQENFFVLKNPECCTPIFHIPKIQHALNHGNISRRQQSSCIICRRPS